jgi:2-(1,2-epoxy-1,2-dihydrophenyl)acetyl-CoA isomerase
VRDDVDAIQIDRNDGLVTITFNRPEKKNALNADSWNELDRALAEIAFNPEDRAVMITGSGGNFSAGADLSPRDPNGVTLGLTGRPVQPIVQEMRVVGDMILRLHRLPKPTIAKVDGVAVGVGLGVALACDLVVASDRARFSEIFSKRGLALDGGNSWILPRIVGLQQAKYLAYFGDVIDAHEARELGLVTRVVPHDQLDAVAGEWARRLAAGPTLALSLTKRLLNSSGLSTFEQAVEEEARCQHIAYTTADMQEGMASFRERREPNFRGY